MKTKPIPIIAVFKNGIVNVNKAVAIVPSVVGRMTPDVVLEQSEIPPALFSRLVPLGGESVGNGKADSGNVLVDVLNISALVDKLKNFKIRAAFTFICDGNGNIEMCLVNTENFGKRFF